MQALATERSSDTRSELRGAVATLGAYMRDAFVAKPLRPDGKRVRNGGVPKEIMISGPAATGKSWGIASLLLWLATTHQGTRILIVRKTRASLTESVCVTIEKILGSGSSIVGGRSREDRHDYKIGKSVIVLGSMENPDRLYSTEWDVVWIEEAREVARGPYIKFLRAIRNNAVSKLPFQLLLTSTNPDSPAHHLYQRWKKLKRICGLVSQHKDNPAMWDEATQSWSEYGEETLDSLKAMDGNEYRRLFLGEWVAAEGAIYPDYDPDKHACTLARDAAGWVTEDALQAIKARDIYAGYDFGYGHAGVILVAALTADSKLYVIEQIYRSREQISWFADELKKIHDHYRLSLVFCDHASPGSIDLFNDVLGAERDGVGSIAVKADKDVDRGLQITRARLGKEPGIFFDKNSLKVVDSRLATKLKPTRVEEEIPGYVLASSGLLEDGGEIKDKPLKKDDDGVDALRYLCVGLYQIEPSPLRKRYKLFPDGDERHFEDAWVTRQATEVDEEWDRIQGEVVMFA